MEKKLIKELQRITKTNYTSLEILYFEFIGSRYRLEKISKDAEYLLFQHTIFSEGNDQSFQENCSDLADYLKANF